MFKRYFKLLDEKVYFYSYLITFISLFLPWLRSLHIFIPGIILPFGNVLVILLSISAGSFYWLKRKKNNPSISSIIIGMLSVVTTIGYLIAYNPVVKLAGGLYGFSIGIYIATLGSIGIFISGILGLLNKKK